MAFFMIVEKFEERKRKESESRFIVGMVIEGVREGGEEQDKPNEILPCYVNTTESSCATKLLNLDCRARFYVTNIVRCVGAYRLTATSKVITRVSDFTVNMDEVNNFISPSVISVPEAKGSPLKRRISVSGDIAELGEYVATPTYKRRCLKLEGEGVKVDVILWGEAAEESQRLASGAEVTVTALLKEKDRLTSTSSTVVEVAEGGDEIIEKTGAIIAFDDENGFPVEMIMNSGESLYLPQHLNFDIGGVLLPCTIRYTESAKVVTTIHVME